MKKRLFFVLLLSVVCTALSAKENQKNYFTSPEKAAVASHKNLQDKIKENGKDFKKVKAIRKEYKLSKDLECKYLIISTDFKESVTEGKKAIEKFAYEGNLIVSDKKNKQVLKYVAKGTFNITKDKPKKQEDFVYNEDKSNFKKDKLEELILVPYFESEAKEAAKKLVEGYYKQHKEFVKVNIGKVEPCENGYKVTTSRTFYKDSQRYTGNEGTVIFTVQKAEQLADFKLLEKTENKLTEFDNTPVVEEPVENEDEKVESKNPQDLEAIVINGFKLNSDVLSDENKEQLDQVAQILLNNKEVEIELLGHSCGLGDQEVNYNFGIRRAKEAKKYLVSKGVEANRIYVHSYGAKKPLVSNASAENRAQNRRVEIKVIK